MLGLGGVGNAVEVVADDFQPYRLCLEFGFDLSAGTSVHFGMRADVALVNLAGLIDGLEVAVVFVDLDGHVPCAEANAEFGR